MNRWTITRVLWNLWQAAMLGTPESRRLLATAISSHMPEAERLAKQELETVSRKEGRQ